MDPEALTVAMTMAPGVYTRNRMFAFYKDPEVRHAKQRAATIRGVVRQLTGAHGEVRELVLSRSTRGRCILKYRIERLSLARHVDLSDVEAACLTFLGQRAGVPGLHASAEDRALIDGALRRLANGLAIATFEAGLT